jgi:hypothetical protein
MEEVSDYRAIIAASVVFQGLAAIDLDKARSLSCARSAAR